MVPGSSSWSATAAVLVGHHAALLPWERRRRTVRLPLPSTPEAALRAADAALAAASIAHPA